MTPANLLVLATALPLIGFAIVVLLSSRIGSPRFWPWFTVGMVGASLAASTVAYVTFMSGDGAVEVHAWNWLQIGSHADGSPRYLQIGPYVDKMTVLLFAMVTLISTLVHIYSIGYMEGDSRKNRFMAYMQLFTFSMLGIVLGNSLLQLFIFWELVGISSYLLIGFWYEKRGPQLACKKAFVMNRIGDMGFLVGMGILFVKFGGDLVLRAADREGGGVFGSLLLNYPGGAIDALHAGANEWWLTIAGIGLFMGAMGKSAQFPLQTWLPDAMEGPTPVSSIVHSATMVAAGVYLTARIFPLLTPAAHLFVATIGLITLVMAALIACVQTDIKRVLAYSTLSQLGYMVLALGAGSYTFAMFHLVTHAFFKCCLFQCSGSVIHAAHHEQEMTSYGGLMKKMPITAACFAICTLAIAGASIPYTPFGLSGYYSKDGIIAATVNYGDALAAAGMNWGAVFYWGPTIIAYVTAFYMTRAFVLTFLGKPRDKHLYDHAHEVNWTMWAPQVVLAAFAIFIGWGFFKVGANLHDTAPAMAQPFEEREMEHGYHFVHGALLHGFGWMLSIALGFVIYINGFTISSRIAAIPGIAQIHWWLYNKMGFDGLYDIIVVNMFKALAGLMGAFDKLVVDGIVNGAAWVGRELGFLIGGFDYRYVDGTVRGSGRAAVRLGSILHRTQAGNIRMYVLILFVGVFTALAIATPFALGWVWFGLPQH
ncbi:MAG: NADH-quinone oxidoreductase subunit L [Phycisphaerales bacterium]|nr:NADH-quinone oxidoreductase subunit L [Phycisphaerales bacterium]